MSKIVDNYQHLLQLWPLLKAETGDSTSYNRIMGVEAKMQNYKFLFGNNFHSLAEMNYVM